MPPTSRNLNLTGRPAPPPRPGLLRNFYFWMAAGIAFFATAAWSAAISFSDRAALAIVLLSWMAFGSSFLWRIVKDLSLPEEPSVAEVEKWEGYHIEVCELSVKVHQCPKASQVSATSAKKAAGNLSLKRAALASAPVPIGTRSFFHESEEGAEEHLPAGHR